MMKQIVLALATLLYFLNAEAQIKPGFDKQEYKNLLTISMAFDKPGARYTTWSGRYSCVYSSPEVGLDNKWLLWKDDKGTAIISIQGTKKSEASWLANFYAAMIPAKGELQLTDDYKFSYQLSSHPRAAVHVGWTVSLGFLVRDMKPKIDSTLKTGTKDILIVGHSQGGAIAYLLTAYLRQMQLKNELPKDICIKTYCSAAPKPGNAYFAYEYEALTQGGWAFNVINAADWVHQTPFSSQGLSDFNEVNPFVNAKSLIKKQGWPKKWALKFVYGKMTKPAKKALKIYQKYLGDFVSKSVKKNLDGFEKPGYYRSSDYVRTGTAIVLYPDEEYYKKYPQDKTRPFINHSLSCYLYLADKLSIDGSTGVVSTSSLNGSWQLNFISGSKMAFEALYPGKKPFLKLDVSNSKMLGATGCNIINGTVKIEGSKIFFPENTLMTKMACEGDGESTFLDMLKKVNGYSVDGDILTFTIDGTAIMRFGRLGEKLSQ